ncbi:MAG: transporter [Pirellulales bacterium]|nr:transporter [Pirellulales bacterium]
MGTLFGDENQCQADDDDNDDDDKPKCNFGPCYCQPRKTLLQWSYGTTFSGGPPGMDEPLVSDRPDFTEASVTVGRGVYQVEMGYTFTLDRSGGTHSAQHSFPEMLWRIGLFAEWFEFRIQYNYGASDMTVLGVPATPRQFGSQDLYLGTKIGLTPQEGILPEMVIIPQMTVPSGSASQTAGEVMPGLNWCYGWELNDLIGVGASTQLNRTIDDAGNIYSQFAQSITIGYTLTKKLGAYTEWFCFVPNGRTVAQVQHYIDGGFAYHVTNNFQLDIRAGVGLNEPADNMFAGAGSVMRF